MIALGTGMLAASGALLGQQRPKVWKVGYLTPGGGLSYHGEFPRAMRALGYEEGRNLVIERRHAQSRFERLPALAAELVREKVDVIVVSSTPAMQAAMKATTSIPIVMALVGNPVASGFIASLARPGGNVTGLSLATTDTSAKWLELAKAVAPNRRVALLVNPSQQTAQWHIGNIESAAKKLGNDVFTVPAATPEGIAPAFAEMARGRAGVVIIVPSGLFDSNGKAIGKLSIQYGLAAIGSSRVYAEDGALASYGQDYAAFVRRSATYVDRILKGARPSDLPVEQPTIYELVINRATAKKLGLSLSPELILRANQVLE